MSHRSAVALPAVLLAMALVSALVVGGVYAARTMGIRARVSTSSADIDAPVERALIELVAAWDTAGRVAMPIGTTASVSPTSLQGVPVMASVTRLNEHTYWFVAEAEAPESHGIRSRLALLIRAAEGIVRPVPGPAWTRLP